MPDFVVWLGDRSRDFRHLKPDQLNTKDEGTYQVYNALRKKMEKIEEKPATPTPVPVTKTSLQRLRRPQDSEEARKSKKKVMQSP